jgi:methylenetetrahydrofolate reductase (NADPH)
MTGCNISFEFFPPRTPAALENLGGTRVRLARFAPEFFSVTFGAGGSTRELTLETVLATRAATGIDSAPHISCVGSSTAALREVLQQYLANGVRRIVALRGDMPSGLTGVGELRYASELVEFIRRETGAAFRIEVAAYPEFHPQATSVAADLDNFRRKVAAGADGAITQYFYNPDAYARFVDDCAKLGVTVPIVPGVMPITNFSQLSRFSEMCGAEVPRWITRRLRDFGDDRAKIREFGADVTAELCATLLARGAPGLHFYTMNQADAVEKILQRLGYSPDHARGRGAEAVA